MSSRQNPLWNAIHSPSGDGSGYTAVHEPFVTGGLSPMTRSVAGSNSKWRMFATAGIDANAIRRPSEEKLKCAASVEGASNGSGEPVATPRRSFTGTRQVFMVPLPGLLKYRSVPSGDQAALQAIES